MNKNISKFTIHYLFLTLCNVTSITFTNDAPYKFKKLTVLTQPIGLATSPQYGGHYALTRSYLDGLHQINAPFNYNPSTMKDVGEVVHVLGDINALKQAIVLKREGQIKKLIAGPTLVVRADDDDNIASSPEIDAYILNSNWTKVAYEEVAPSLVGRTKIWYGGVDHNFWDPNKKYVLVYWKTESESFCIEIENILRNYGEIPLRIKYGSYKSNDFKNALLQAKYAIFISKFESQGIALAEAWSMNVPTLVWNSKPRHVHNRIYSTISACPYLTPQTGFEWENLDDLECLLQQMPNLLQHVAPRKWVLENMTDKISATVLVNIINDISSE
jgi:hypothetical protein